MVKVSVIMPVYNVEEYLKHSLDCLTNQTLRDIEIICVDDESEDLSREIITGYTNKDSRVKLLTQKHSFAGAARNLGLKHACGEYVMFLDPDDYCDVTMLETLYNQIEKDNTDMTLCGIYSVSESGIKYLAPSYQTYVNALLDNRIFTIEDVGNDIYTFLVYPYNKIYKRNFLEKNNIKFQEIQNTNDASFAFEALTAASKISLLNKAFYYYRHSRPGNTRLTKGKNLNCVIDAYEYAYERCKKYDTFKNIEAGFSCVIITSLIWHLNVYCSNYDKDKQFFYEYIRHYLLRYEFSQNEYLKKLLKFSGFNHYVAAELILKNSYKSYCKIFPNKRQRILKTKLDRKNFKLKFLFIPLYCHTFKGYQEKVKILGITVFKQKIRSGNNLTKYLFGVPISSRKVIPAQTELYLNYIINNTTEQVKTFYIMSDHIGETFLLSNLLDRLLKEDNITQAAVVLRNAYQKDILQMFAPQRQIISSTVVENHDRLHSSIVRYIGKELNFKCCTFRMLMPISFWYTTHIKNKHYYDLICQELNIKDCTFTPKADLSSFNMEHLEDHIEKSGLNIDNFVFLAPESCTVKTLPDEFWNNLAAELQSQGYDIYLNITNRTDLIINGTKTFKTNIPEAYVLAMKAKFIIGMRSGLIEVLAATSKPVIAVYNGDNRLKRNSLKRLPYINQNIVREFDNSKKSCFNDIINITKSKGEVTL